MRLSGNEKRRKSRSALIVNGSFTSTAVGRNAQIVAAPNSVGPVESTRSRQSPRIRGLWLATDKRIEHCEFTLECFDGPECQAFKSRPRMAARPARALLVPALRAFALTGARLRRTSSSASSSIAARAVRRDSTRTSGRRRSPAVQVPKPRPSNPLGRAAAYWPPCITFFT